ncbi:hypothetical protein ADICYQ_5328 [Cyclobacterium qasimii M12-11B]|uniref:Uncharacterized protein n=1 Tax=Cyclobacterium qasimii M12-11B TaxID=641524 RepID=S7WNE5_9BACT|nr:hypothetical protein ADICYQ_5328 [Cyclobacterium qasimii M12-11B]
MNSNGDKIVWVNFFCDHGGLDWTNVIIGADDGGNCYAHITVNLTNGSCNDILVNGYS